MPKRTMMPARKYTSKERVGENKAHQERREGREPVAEIEGQRAGQWASGSGQFCTRAGARLFWAAHSYALTVYILAVAPSRTQQTQLRAKNHSLWVQNISALECGLGPLDLLRTVCTVAHRKHLGKSP